MLDDEERHFPAKPDKFEFDGEVARVFPDMAIRSIPNFQLAHEMHAKMAKLLIHADNRNHLRVLDVGASRGQFLRALYGSFRTDEVSYVAVDNSKEMCEYIRQEFPTDVEVFELDVTSNDFLAQFHEAECDVICCNYVLQFLPPEKQYEVLMHLMSLLSTGGLLFLGHKTQHNGAIGAAAHELYLQWRVGNGYTREEIEAKSRALKGSMFPMDHQTVIDFLTDHGFVVQETTRFMMFSSLAAMKNT